MQVMSSALEGVAGGSPGLELCLGRLAARELPGSKDSRSTFIFTGPVYYLSAFPLN